MIALPMIAPPMIAWPMIAWPIHALANGAGAALLIYAAGCDLVRRRIPNLLSGLLFLAGCMIRLQSGDWRAGLLFAVVIFLAGFLIWLSGAVGGGDVKLLAASAMFVAPGEIFRLLALMSLLGGTLALLYLALPRLLALARIKPPRLPPGRRHWLARCIAIEHRRITRRGPLPYAVAIAGAALATAVR